MHQLTSQDLLNHLKNNGNVLDIRPPDEFTSGFISGSIFLYPDDNFPLYLKSFFNPAVPLIIVSDSTGSHRVIELFKSVGFDSVKGFIRFDQDVFLRTGIDVDLIIGVEPDEFAMDLKFDEQLTAVDLRKTEEYRKEHIKGTISLPLAELADVAEIANLDDGGCVYFYSDNDKEAVTAASLLKKQGLHNLRAVQGGWHQIRTEDAVILEKSGGPPKHKKKAP